MEIMPWLGSGNRSKKAKTSVGIEFMTQEGLDEWECLALHIIEQAMVDYTNAWKYLSRLKKLPADFSKWSDKDYRMAYYHLNDIKTIYEIERFLKSRWFAFLYPDLDPNIIKTTLQNKSKATYGALIGHDRINKINAKLKYWVPTHYNRKGLHNG